MDHLQLKRLLASSAQKNARTAVTLFSSSDDDLLLEAAVACGTAVELLAKAYCASISYGLLADRGDRDSILLLDGQQALTSAVPSGLRSITALDALKLVKYLHKPFPVKVDAVISLRVRNSAAHMALVDSGELRTGISEMVGLFEALLPMLELDAEPFWGKEAYPVVSSILDRNKTDLARAVEGKIAAARRYVASITKDVPPDQVDAVLNALSGRLTVSSDHDEGQECPACGKQGWLLCHVELGPVAYDNDSVTSGPEEIAYPTDFECPVCQLSLSGDELFEYPDFPLEIPIAESEYAEHWEPDEDYYRDR